MAMTYIKRTWDLPMSSKHDTNNSHNSDCCKQNYNNNAYYHNCSNRPLAQGLAIVICGI